jgi:hypothetical protein
MSDEEEDDFGGIGDAAFDSIDPDKVKSSTKKPYSPVGGGYYGDFYGNNYGGGYNRGGGMSGGYRTPYKPLPSARVQTITSSISASKRMFDNGTISEQEHLEACIDDIFEVVELLMDVAGLQFKEVDVHDESGEVLGNAQTAVREYITKELFPEFIEIEPEEEEFNYGL